MEFGFISTILMGLSNLQKNQWQIGGSPSPFASLFEQFRARF
jgi:hypothetical protein